MFHPEFAFLHIYERIIVPVLASALWPDVHIAIFI